MSHPTPAGRSRPRPLPAPRPARRRPLPAPRPLEPQQHALEPQRALPAHRPLWLRRPNLVRAGAGGAIAAGTALFVLVSVLTPGAGAQPGSSAPSRASQPTLAPLAVAPADVDALQYTRTPHTVAKKTVKPHGDASPATISGLAANGIPSVALNAYRVAAARMTSADSGCGIDWALLAGIGRVESDHGRFAGAVLRSDGTSSPKIVGPALNGHGTALIPAPANGAALDGDAVYTHALGPMQFIPQTWAGYGADADGDGVANIFDIDDAALGAARYLCAAGGDLRSHDGQVRAVLAYNHVASYVAEVLALADAYRRGVPISGIPVGVLTGGLPPVKKTGTPVDPGPPTAIGKGGGGGGKGGGSKGGKGGGSKGGGAPSRPGGPSQPGGSSSSAPPSSSHPSAPSSSSSSHPSGTPTSPSSTAPSSSSSPSPSPTCRLHVGTICVAP